MNKSFFSFKCSRLKDLKAIIVGSLVGFFLFLATRLCIFLFVTVSILFCSDRILMAQRDYLEPVNITPRQLVEAYLNDFHSADARYTGRLIVLTGRIRSIFPPDQTYRRHPYAFITMDSGPYQPVIVYLWEWEAETLERVRPGRTTTVMGFCQGITPQLSLVDSCLYPGGCGGPVAEFYGPYFKLPPTPPRSRPR